MGLIGVTLETTPNTPPTGQLTLFAANDKFLRQIDDTGTIKSFQTAYPPITASTSGINTAETIIIQSLLLPANMLQVGTTFRITLLGTCTATAANASTFTLRVGTAGTTSDASIATAAVTSATSGTTVGFRTVIEFTVLSLNGTGTYGEIQGSVTVLNTGITGISTNNSNVIPLTVTATLNTATANYLSITYKSAATTTTSIFNNAFIEIVKI